MSTNRKKLPKAIRRPADDPLHAGVAATIAETPGDVMKPEADRAEPVVAQPFAVANGFSRHALPREEHHEPVSAAPSVTSYEPPLNDAARRRAVALAVIERYAIYAAGGGLVPLPLANLAGVMAINMRMARMLSNLYGVPFERERNRAIVAGFAAGTMPTGLAAVTASTLNYLIPLSAVAALAVSSVAAAALTRSVGRHFVVHFERETGTDLLPSLGSVETIVPIAS